MVVPEDLVVAAHPICDALPYTTPDNCNPVDDRGHGLVTVASSAARYNPVFYWVIGTAARPFDGAAALYAMRVAASILAALLVAMACSVTSRWSSTAWPVVSILLVLTPVMTYSNAVAAPNGVEIGAGLLLWTSLIGIARRVRQGNPVSASSVILTCLSIGVLATVRSLGPLWLVVIGALVFTSVRTEAWRVAARTQPRSFLAPVIAAVVCVAAAGWWTLASGANGLANTNESIAGSPFPSVLTQPLVWMFQSVAAFPSRDQLAPPAVYAIYLSLPWVFIALGWLVASAKARRGMFAVLASSIVIPIVFSVLSYSQLGFAWQGRYTWPLAMGLPLLAGASLDVGKFQLSTRAAPLLVSGVAVLCALGTVIGQVFVLHNQLATSPLAHDPSWIKPSTLVVILLSSSGFLILALGMSGVLRAGVATPVKRFERDVVA